MSKRPHLTGYCHSVYTRVARIALAEKGVAYDYAELDPFEEGSAENNTHPFGRVPVLLHGDFALYETAAITAYVDAAFDGPALVPGDPKAAARVEQVIRIVDAYAYWPLVRQVYSHAVFRPAFGESFSEQTIRDGLAEAPAILAALEAFASEGRVLNGGFTRADCHLVPMIASFAMAPEGAEMLAGYPALSRWWGQMAGRPSVEATQTPLPTGGAERLGRSARLMNGEATP